MTKLSQSQLTLLTAAAATVDGRVATPPGAGGAKTATALIKSGLMMSLPGPEGPSRLMITDKGRAATPGQPAPPESAPTPKPETVRRKAEAEAALDRPKMEAKGKHAMLVDLLKRQGGATVEDMTAATGWQAHSVRGAISGSLKKAMGLTVTSEKVDGVRTYRIVEGAKA